MISLETWIGLRYLRAKKRSGFMSFIGIISIIGIAIGVMALIVVLSVVNGFQKDVRSQLFSVAPHAEIGFYDAENGGSWQDLRKMVAGNKNVLGSAPYIADQALLANNGVVRGVQVRGIDPQEEKQVVDYWKKMTAGKFEDLKPGEFDIILGQELANELGAEVGGKVTVITPEGNVTPAGVVPRLKQFNVVGVVKTGLYELDNTLTLTHIEDARTLYRFEGGFAGLRLKLADPQNAPAVVPKLLPADAADRVWARDWTFSNQSYFNAVELEKKMLFVVMFFISLVASINLISTLIMTVTEKQAAIAILRTLGLPPRGIMKIFLVQGTLLGVIGTAIGVVLGVTVALNVGAIVSAIEQMAGRKLVTSAIYFIDYMPSQVKLSDVLAIVAISLGLSFVATLLPSWRASKTQPAEALRYE